MSNSTAATTTAATTTAATTTAATTTAATTTAATTTAATTTEVTSTSVTPEFSVEDQITDICTTIYKAAKSLTARNAEVYKAIELSCNADSDFADMKAHVSKSCDAAFSVRFEKFYDSACPEVTTTEESTTAGNATTPDADL